jgi:hypothetical protein
MRVQQWRPSTRSLAESHFKRPVYPVLRDRRIGSIRPNEIKGAD